MNLPKPIKFRLVLPFVFLLISACSGMPPTSPPQATSTLTIKTQPADAYPPPETPVPTLTPEAGYPAPETPLPEPSATLLPTETLPPATDAPAMTFRDFEISPSKITIKAGTKVVFTVESASGNCHEPYSSYPDRTDPSGLFDSGALSSGASYAYTFRQVGTFTIRCGCHPDMMVATVEVLS